MRADRSFQRMAAILAVLSPLFAFGNTLTMVLAVNGKVEAVTNPLAVLASGVRGAALWRWSMVLDLQQCDETTRARVHNDGWQESPCRAREALQ